MSCHTGLSLSADEALLAEEAVEFASTVGLTVVVDPTAGSYATSHAPLSALPVGIASLQFHEATHTLAPAFGRLMAAVSSDFDWLTEIVQPTFESDPFTARLHALAAATRHLEPQPVLGILRSDYMVDGFSGMLKQVEINTIAAAFGGLAEKVRTAHGTHHGSFPTHHSYVRC